MTIEQITTLMAAPEKLIDPRQVNLLSSYIGGYISDLEEELNERNYQCSVRWGELREAVKSDAKADRALELTQEYREREKQKLLLSKLKRFRADLKDRFLVVTNQKR